ncbi:MAG: hypothetical protein ACKV0T_19195, partial [Planctomycetales bacterium]
GLGTAIYGWRPAAEGRHIVTKWLTLLFFPIVPIRSYLVDFSTDGRSVFSHFLGHIGIIHNAVEGVAAPTLCWGQVLNTLLYVYLPWTIALIVGPRAPDFVGETIAGLIIASWFFAGYKMRHRRRRCEKGRDVGRISAALILFLFSAAATVQGGEKKPPGPSRLEFSEAIRDLKEGMPASKVRRVLGPPDDIRTRNDPGGISSAGTKEIWRYGTSGHLKTATLGQVYLDHEDRVQCLFGEGKPPPQGMFEERELRGLLEALGEVPSYNQIEKYNPRKVIRAVNLLQPLGKEKALVAIDEFLRVTSSWHDESREGMFLVLRTLFEVPDDPGYMPTMNVGAPHPVMPKDPKLLPRFPIALEGDIPFLLVEGYSLFGEGEHPEQHVEYFRQHGKLRAKPLQPAGNPFAELDKFSKSPRWIFKQEGETDDTRARHFLGQQVLRLTESVYHVEPDDYGDLLPWDEKELTAQWKKITDDLTKIKFRWDSRQQKYLFADGTSLVEPIPKSYRREIWNPNIPNLNVEVTIEREGRRRVYLLVNENFRREISAPACAVKIYNVKAKDKPVLEADCGGKHDGKSGSSSSGKTCTVLEGEELQVELIVKGKSQVSPVYRP